MSESFLRIKNRIAARIMTIIKPPTQAPIIIHVSSNKKLSKKEKNHNEY